MDKWEYRCVYGDLNQKQLNAHGATGWELVVVTVTGMYIFKRKIEVVKLRKRKTDANG